MNGRLRRKTRLQSKLTILFLFMAATVSAAVTAVGYKVYTNDMTDSYNRISSGISQVIVSTIDTDSAGRILKGEKNEDYEHLKERMLDLLESVPDVESVYIYSMERDGMHMLLDTNRLDMDPGTVSEYWDNIKKYREDLFVGREIKPYISEQNGRKVMKDLVPVYDIRGNCVCYAGCDVSMEDAFADRRTFTVSLAIVVFIPAVLVSLAASLFVRRRVMDPINRLGGYLADYARGDVSKAEVRKKLEAFGKKAANEMIALRDEAVKLLDDIERYSGEENKYGMNITKSIETVMKAKGNKSERLEKYSEYARLIMDELRKEEKYRRLISDETYNDIIKYAPLYDMGELFISDSIMKKKGRLTDEEFEKMRTHTVRGKNVIDEISNAVNRDENNEVLKQMAELHHERWDGKGYPNGLAGEEIPISARIVAVFDVFNAIITKSNYKQSQSVDRAMSIIEQERGKQFDADIVDAFLRCREGVEELVKKYEV